MYFVIQYSILYRVQYMQNRMMLYKLPTGTLQMYSIGKVKTNKLATKTLQMYSTGKVKTNKVLVLTTKTVHFYLRKGVH